MHTRVLTTMCSFTPNSLDDLAVPDLKERERERERRKHKKKKR